MPHHEHYPFSVWLQHDDEKIEDSGVQYSEDGPGIADGLGYENNTRASTHRSFICAFCGALTSRAGLITRGLAEMTRIGTAYGASPLTFLSLAGVGDLFLTCSSPTSRNYTVGFRLGKGEKLDEIIRALGSVAEGVTTSKGLKAVIDELGVEAPIAAGVYGVLYEGTPSSLRPEQYSADLRRACLRKKRGK